MVTQLTGKNFDSTIKKGSVIIDFYADWCGPCKVMAPQFVKAAEKLKNVTFAKLNVDDEYEIASRYQVMSIPTTIFFQDGEVVDRFTGAMTADMIERKAKEAF